MDENDVKVKLIDLEAATEILNKVMADRANAVEVVTPPEVKKAIEEVYAEFSPVVNAAGEQVDQLNAEVKKAVLELGATVKGESLMAVYSPGSERVNTTLIKGLALAIPEVAKAIEPGTPSVSIRAVGKK